MNVRNAFPMGAMYVAMEYPAVPSEFHPVGGKPVVVEYVRLPSGRWIVGTLEDAGTESPTCEAAYQRWLEKRRKEADE